MRLNKLITGHEIWAGRSMTKRVVGADGKFSKVIRLNGDRARHLDAPCWVGGLTNCTPRPISLS